MSNAIVKHPIANELVLIRLAREIAMDIRPLPEILETYKLTQNDFDQLSKRHDFLRLLESASQEWQSATNTAERTKAKAAALIEEWLPEANERLHDHTESLDAKTKLATLIARVGGHGVTNAGVEGGGGERFSVTINLGADANLKFEGALPPKVIEGEAVEV